MLFPFLILYPRRPGVSMWYFAYASDLCSVERRRFGQYHHWLKTADRVGRSLLASWNFRAWEELTSHGTGCDAPYRFAVVPHLRGRHPRPRRTREETDDATRRELQTRAMQTRRAGASCIKDAGWMRRSKKKKTCLLAGCGVGFLICLERRFLSNLGFGCAWMYVLLIWQGSDSNLSLRGDCLEAVVV